MSKYRWYGEIGRECYEECGALRKLIGQLCVRCLMNYYYDKHVVLEDTSYVHSPGTTSNSIYCDELTPI